jgi:cytochrome o ubiquinol oxidase subunit II
VQQFPTSLDMTEYEQLAKPSEKTPVTFYSSAEQNLYNKVITKFMAPSAENQSIHEIGNMEGMEHY